MAEAAGLKKKSTTKSGLGLILLVVGVVIAIALIAYALMMPGVLESVATAAIIIIGAIVAIAIIAYAIMLIIAVPMYMAKGEQVQEGVEYGLDSVKSVENSSSDDPKNN